MAKQKAKKSVSKSKKKEKIEKITSILDEQDINQAEAVEGEVVEYDPNKTKLDKDWTPTPLMREWLDKSMELMTDKPKEVADALGCSHVNWYNWIKQNDFIEWYAKEWNTKMQIMGQQLDMIGLKFSKSDYKYWKVMMERVGLIGDNSSTRANTAIQMNVSFIKNE